MTASSPHCGDRRVTATRMWSISHSDTLFIEHQACRWQEGGLGPFSWSTADELVRPVKPSFGIAVRPPGSVARCRLSWRRVTMRRGWLPSICSASGGTISRRGGAYPFASPWARPPKDAGGPRTEAVLGRLSHWRALATWTGN